MTEFDTTTGSQPRRRAGLFAALSRRIADRRAIRALHDLDDRLLADMGLTRNDLSRLK